MSGCCKPENEEPECADEATDPCAATATPQGTYCNGDTKDNVWVERAPWSPDAAGICLLDTMCEDQIIDVLTRDDRARADLLRVTTDPHLLELARTVPRLPSMEPEDALQKEINRDKDSIPFFSIFRGQPPFAQ